MYAFAGDALDGLIDGTGVVRVVSKPGLDLQRSFWTDGRSNRHVTPIETKSRRPRCCQPGPPRSSFLNWGELGAIPHKPTLSRESGSRAFQGPLALRCQLLIFRSEFQVGLPELFRTDVGQPATFLCALRIRPRLWRLHMQREEYLRHGSAPHCIPMLAH
jgi:hypothetical protein